MTRNEKGQFLKGKSGNPSGRKKLSEIERQTMESISRLAPKAVRELERIIDDKKTSKALKIKAIELIFDRVCGKTTDIKALEKDPVTIVIDV